MIAITHATKKVMAVSCTHGLAIDPDAERAILDFRADFKPDVTLHLGDWMDTAAFMSGKGSDSRTQSIRDDLAAGIDFLRAYEPNVVCCGNHDHRLWKDVNHHDQLRAEAARATVQSLETCISLLNARFVPYTGALDAAGWIKIGPIIFGHGVMYNEQAARDHAEAFAAYADHVVFGHTHRIMQQSGRTMRPTMGYSIGCACNKPMMEYAKGRRATMAWQHALLEGEIKGDDACLRIRPLGTDKPTPMPEIML